MRIKFLNKVTTTIVHAMLFLLSSTVNAQILTVYPVTLQMAPGQMTSTFTVMNEGKEESSIQVRVFAWRQLGTEDQLSPTDDILASPPLTSILPGQTQIVRFILRRAPQGQEATYRIMLDQIPPPAAPDSVRLSIRQSIPVFAEPTTRATAYLRFSIETETEQNYLTVTNEGNRHEMVNDIALTTSGGKKLEVKVTRVPYVLAGGTRRWRIVGALPKPVEGVRLSATLNSGRIDQAIDTVKKKP